MESSTTRKDAEQRKQEDIRRQIAALQAQLADPGATLIPASPKRKQPPPGVLAPASPSPKRRKIASHNAGRSASRGPLPRFSTGASTGSNPSTSSRTASTHAKMGQSPTPAPSTVIQKLASVHAQKNNGPSEATVVRSSGFAERAAPIAAHGEGAGSVGETAQARDERLALIEDLVPGSVEHTPPFDDPHFEKLEPNSGIRLSSRSTPYEDFQDYLRGRYYLSPSKLYSVVRLLPNKQAYDVPVVGDWLTIAVVAERGKVKYSQAPVGIGREDKVVDDGDEPEEGSLSGLVPDSAPKPPARGGKRGAQKEDAEARKPTGKKYVNMKLVDFGCRVRGSASGGQAAIRGDAFLSLLLFEADSVDGVAHLNGRKEKVYRGGSRGAFEKMSMLREGAVVAFLNPRILKPFQRSRDVPHPTDNILAITPESVASLAVIGYAQDLGMCTVTKRDGTPCGSWCDKRVSDVCDWHIQNAVSRKRAGRAEFASGTSGMTAGAAKKRTFDPARKWGLQPEPDASGATYVVSGHTISGGADTGSLFVGETMGRDAQARASRKLSTKDADRALQKLLKRDKTGAQAVVSARAYGKKLKEEAQAAKPKPEDKRRDKGKGKAKLKAPTKAVSEDDNSDESSDDEGKKQNKAYSVQLIRQLGFDPSAKDGRRIADANVQIKLDTLTAVHAKRAIQLGPRPGKSSTCVHRPAETKNDVPSTVDDPPEPENRSQEESPLQMPISDDDDDDDLEREEKVAFGKAIKPRSQDAMVDLDSSDGELVVEPAT